MCWNVSDGNFPSEFSTGKPEMIEEERRLLYVAMTRARNELHLCAPLKYQVTQQPKDGDKHVFGAKSRFMTERVLASCEQISLRNMRGVESFCAEGDRQIGNGRRGRAAQRNVVNGRSWTPVGIQSAFTPSLQPVLKSARCRASTTSDVDHHRRHHPRSPAWTAAPVLGLH